MVAETSSRGSRFFPEIRIGLRSSNQVVVSSRLQAALLSTVLAGTAAFAYLGVSRQGMEHLAAKREAAAEHFRAANSDLQNRIGGLARQLASLMRERDRAQNEAATSAEQAGRLGTQLGSTQAKLRDQSQLQQALQQQQAQNAALAAQLGKIAKDRAAEATQLAQDQASLEETAKELADLLALRGKMSAKQEVVQLRLTEIWRKLSEIKLPLPTGQPQRAAAEATAGGAADPTASRAGDLGPAAAAKLEQGLRAAGVDVRRILSQLGDHAEGGPFVPPPKADGATGDQAGREKLAALEALTKTLPLAAPLAHYEIGSRFGPRIDPFNHRAAFHTGLDLDAPYSAPVYATAAGTVIYAGWLSEYGQVVEIDHGFGIVTLYAHLRRCLVEVGQTVAPQAEIGIVGTTGRSTGPHVHYEVRVDGQPQDPEKFLNLEHLLPPAVSRPLIPTAGGSAESSR